MNSDRKRVQLWCEQRIGAKNLQDWSAKRRQFEQLVLTRAEVAFLQNALRADAEDYVYNGLCSLFDAVRGITRGESSWPVIQLYYSVYFFLRATLGFRRKAIVRNRSLYILDIAVGASPSRKAGNKYQTDHKATVALFGDYFAGDPLLSNTIESENPHSWLMERRHEANYRTRVFTEPGAHECLSKIRERCVNGDLNVLIDAYLNDPTLVYPFQPEHAMLAQPIRRAQAVLSEWQGSPNKRSLDTEQAEYLGGLIEAAEQDTSALTALVP